MTWLQSRLAALVALASRYPGLLAAAGFASGLASYLLVERSATIAQAITLLLLLGWLLLLLEQGLRTSVLARFGLGLPPVLVRLATQMLHQESLFFVLPFFLAVTHWGSGQSVVTLLLVLAALVSVIDPIYLGYRSRHRTLLMRCHSLTLFAALLVALPVIARLSSEQGYLLALLLALFCSVPGWAAALARLGRWRWLALPLLLALMATTLWQWRQYVPPVPMRLSDVKISLDMDREQREPLQPLTRISADRLLENGLYAWSAVQAPRGLREVTYHEWRHRGELVDRIALEIRGGREAGYRAWSHKLHFPADPTGPWQVRIATGTGRLIGQASFTVTAPARDATSQTNGTEALASEIEKAFNAAGAVGRQ